VSNSIVSVTNVPSSTLTLLSSVGTPAFESYEPNLTEIEAAAKRFRSKKNVVVIGNGGSINNFGAFYCALGSKKNVFLLNTLEPDVIASIKKQCRKSNTVVVPVSKSGNTVSVLEALLCFADYPVVALTTLKGTLGELAKKKKWQYVLMPDSVGGRFAGRTACALLPCALLGYDIAAINKGAKKMGEGCKASSPLEKNPAKQLAYTLFTLYEKGYHEIFMPVYSTALSGFNQLIVQLVHESCGKEGKGHTIYAALAPESQHHTNQRFFGGRQDVLGLFVKQECFMNQMKVNVPSALKDVPLKENTLSLLNGMDLAKALEFEYIGTQKDAAQSRIPNITLSVDKINEFSLGEYLTLWQYTTVYLATLFGVNPYDQPQVENSKRISYELTKEYAKK